MSFLATYHVLVEWFKCPFGGFKILGSHAGLIEGIFLVDCMACLLALAEVQAQLLIDMSIYLGPGQE